MSTITVSNIKATGETASRAVSGVAAAHFGYNQNGGSGAMDIALNALSSQSFNASSFTDNGTGDASVGLTNAMSNRSYTFLSGCWYNNNVATLQTASSTTSTVNILAHDADSGTIFDHVSYAAILGDLA